MIVKIFTDLSLISPLNIIDENIEYTIVIVGTEKNGFINKLMNTPTENIQANIVKILPRKKSVGLYIISTGTHFAFFLPFPQF